MTKNLSLSFAVALALSALGGVARASTPAPEAGNPHSIDNRNREVPPSWPTQDQLNALETGNPDSVDYRNRDLPDRSTNEQIYTGESEDPNSVDNKERRNAVESAVPHKP
jgi:hypothetical protein